MDSPSGFARGGAPCVADGSPASVSAEQPAVENPAPFRPAVQTAPLALVERQAVVSPSAGVIVSGPGRKKRSQARTVELIKWSTDILDRHSHVVDEFLTSPDQRIRFDAWKFLFQYRWGLPTQRVEVDMMARARELAEQIGVDLHVLLATAAQFIDTKAGPTE